VQAVDELNTGERGNAQQDRERAQRDRALTNATGVFHALFVLSRRAQQRVQRLLFRSGGELGRAEKCVQRAFRRLQS
jgi:hypothetical protein